MGQFPSGARPALPRTHALLDRLGCTHPAAAAPAQAGILPVPARNTRSQRPCKAPPRAQVVSGHPSAEHRIGPQVLHSDSQHPLNAGSFTDHGTCDGFLRAAGVGQFPSGARPAVPRTHALPGIGSVCTHPAAAAPAQAGILPVPARNTRSQRPCKAPPRAQVVSGYPLLNTESALRLSILTPGTR